MKWTWLFAIALFAEEPDSEFKAAQQFNHSLGKLKQELHQKFEEANLFAKEKPEEQDFLALLSEIKKIREKIKDLEESWRKSSTEELSHNEEPYAMWDVGETTLSQLIMEYGASDVLYVIPPELSSMKISLFSGIPLPHESWSEVIEMILMQNGVGIKKLSPFVKQLYILKMDPSAVEAILAKEADLALFSSSSRLFYVFSPPAEQLKSVQSFFERFSDPKQTIVQAVGSKIALLATQETIQKMIGLYHAVWEQGQGKIVRIATLQKIAPPEAEKVLKAVFSEPTMKSRPPFYPSGADELYTMVLPQGLALIGETKTVERAQSILKDMENQLEDPEEKIIYWYQCKHSDPEEVAHVLSQVYESLGSSSLGTLSDSKAIPSPSESKKDSSSPSSMKRDKECLPTLCPGPGFNPTMPASAPFIQPPSGDKEKVPQTGNFIIDPKTTSILMVIQREELPKMKALLKKLDVPKRMVQLDVMLIEKKFKDNREVGFNLLELGTNSSGKRETAATYSGSNDPGSFRNGLFSFIFSKPSGGFPAANMKFNFLLAQEDVRIKASPSVLAVNQTPAQIAIVEEISINNGAFPFNSPTGTIVQNSFTRAQYGITIHLTPTIHLATEEGSSDFISLETDLEFDSTTILSADNRPPVTRRNIKNQVRVADGETIILGGLRQQIEESSREKIPFLGELPGIGKLFGTSRARDVSTEMFIFITPKIIHNPVDDLRAIRQEEYVLRAGDIPEFLKHMDDAKKQENKRIFQQSLKLLFDVY